MTTTHIAPSATAPSNEEIAAVLEPFALCAAPFGFDWSDGDEIACEPWDDEHGGGNGNLLFTIRVGQFRSAASILSRLRAPAPAAQECPAETLGALLAGIREAGWSVACHNDYRLNRESRTFWLFTHPSGRWAKGEGETDVEALTGMLAAAPVHQAAAEPTPEQPAVDTCPTCGMGWNDYAARFCSNGFHLRLSPEPAATDWRCSECNCHTFALVDERQADGSYAPGTIKRCVSCKALEIAAPASGRYPLSYVGITSQGPTAPAPAPEQLAKEAGEECPRCGHEGAPGGLSEALKRKLDDPEYREAYIVELHEMMRSAREAPEPGAPAPEDEERERREDEKHAKFSRQLDEETDATMARTLDKIAAHPPAPALEEPDAATQCTCNPRNSSYLVDHHDQDCDYVSACEDSLERHPILHPRYRRAVAPLEKMVEIPASDARDLDDVVSELGIEDSFTTPAEAVRELKGEVETLRAAIAAATPLPADEPRPAPEAIEEEWLFELVGKHLGPHLAISPTPRYEAVVREFCHAAIAAAPAQNGVDRVTVEKCIEVANRFYLSSMTGSDLFFRQLENQTAWRIINALRALLPIETERQP